MSAFVPAVRPLSARSIVLSLLLGAHPAQLPVAALVELAGTVGVAEPTLRVALTRMVTAGDLERTDGAYRLSDRLLARQRRQDAAVDVVTRAWRGGWEMVVVTASGRDAADRARLRTTLADLRLAELREGVWLRPDNLRRPLPAELADVGERFALRPVPDAAAIAARLWPLTAWAAEGRSLLARLGRARRPADRLALAAAVVRHLVADPVLPPALLPDRWPAAQLRESYATYRGELSALVRGRAG